MRSNLLFTIGIVVISGIAFLLPDLFIQIGGIESKSFIIPLLMLIMFGMGTRLSLNEFVAVWRRPKALGIGLGLQFVVMPVTGFMLATLSELPAEIAAGLILVGCSPSGLASNVMCFIAKANLALSVSLTTCATLIAPFITPLLMELLAGELVTISVIGMFTTMLKLVVLPVIAGMVVNHIIPSRLSAVFNLMPLLSMAGIIFIVAIIIANGQQALASIGAMLVILVLIHNIIGYALGYSVAKLTKMDEASCRALAFEIGLQNSGLASGIALTMNKIATMGLAAALFSSLQNITGSLLAVFWSNNPSKRKA